MLLYAARLFNGGNIIYSGIQAGANTIGKKTKGNGRGFNYYVAIRIGEQQPA
jgi:hypothetical protein